jgi:hypothetical protein
VGHVNYESPAVLSAHLLQVHGMREYRHPQVKLAHISKSKYLLSCFGMLHGREGEGRE